MTCQDKPRVLVPLVVQSGQLYTNRWRIRVLLTTGKAKADLMVENRTLYDNRCLTRYYIELELNRWLKENVKSIDCDRQFFEA